MLRDAGGVPLAGGGHMRTGCVYRFAGALATPDALAELDQVGPLTIVDLRDTREDRSILSAWAMRSGAEYCGQPIAFDVAAVAGGKVRAPRAGEEAEFLQQVYEQLAIRCGRQLAAAFEHISRRFPAAFGCAAGKDRTGVMCAYLHILLGATEETAIEAYLKQAPTVDDLLPSLRVRYGISVEEVVPDAVRELITARDVHIRRALDAVRAQGGVEMFLREHGLDDDVIGRLRAALIEEA
jgi:protein-tyrosine phosphatase